MNIILGLIVFIIFFIVPIYTMVSMMLDDRENVTAWGITLFFAYLILVIKLVTSLRNC